MSEPQTIDVIAGTNLGLLKGISFSSNSQHSLNSINTASKSLEIISLCLNNHSEDMKDDGVSVFCGYKKGNVISYNVMTGKIMDLNFPIIEDKGNFLKDIKSFNSTVANGYKNGHLKAYSLLADKTELSCGNELFDIKTNSNADSNLENIAYNNAFHTLASGGKNNNLKVWDINSPDKPIFSSKNVKHDWLCLQVPIWVTRTVFYENSSKIITGTGHSNVRMYDPGAQRRPVIELNFGENPITALSLRPGSNCQVIVGNTLGSLGLLDLRMKKMVRMYKGTSGGITDLQCHNDKSVFATCSVDRYINLFDIDSGKKLKSVYAKFGLNCLVFTSSLDLDVDEKESRKRAKEAEEDKKKESDNDDENEDDEVWSKMEVVKTKRRKK